MAEPFLGEIRLFAFQGQNPPRGWAVCNGQLLSIAQNTALYSLLGTAYGGDGRVNFALPNLQGRVPVHPQTGSVVGQIGGEEAHVLTTAEMPQHTHQATAGTDATQGSPQGNLWGGGGTAMNYAPQPNVTMSANALAATGQSQAHPNMQPYTVVNYCIATIGVFPSRN